MFMTITVLVIDYILYMVRLVLFLDLTVPHISLQLEARRPKQLMAREIIQAPGIYT
jgi:hypothetical protein